MILVKKKKITANLKENGFSGVMGIDMWWKGILEDGGEYLKRWIEAVNGSRKVHEVITVCALLSLSSF